MQLDQFTMDALTAPAWVLAHQPDNPPLDLRIHLRTTTCNGLLESPLTVYQLAVPLEHRIGLKQKHGHREPLTPMGRARPQVCRQCDQRQFLPSLQNWASLLPAFDNSQLLPQQHDLDIFFPICHATDQCHVQQNDQQQNNN